jgi:hypothetical protein
MVQAAHKRIANLDQVLPRLGYGWVGLAFDGFETISGGS